MRAEDIRPGDQFIDSSVLVYTVDSVIVTATEVIANVTFRADGGQGKRVWHVGVNDATVPLTRPAATDPAPGPDLRASTERTYCDQPHPGSDAEAQRWHEMYHHD